MHNPTLVLAERANFGRVYDCGDCGCIHLQVGPVTLALAPDAYMQLVDMLLASAASFETHMQRNSAAGLWMPQPGEEGKEGLCDS